MIRVTIKPNPFGRKGGGGGDSCGRITKERRKGIANQECLLLFFSLLAFFSVFSKVVTVRKRGRDVVIEREDV